MTSPPAILRRIPGQTKGHETVMDNQDMSDQQLDPQAQQQEENSLIALRKEKLAAERAKGNAFPNDFRRENYCNDLQKQYADKTKEELAKRRSSQGGRAHHAQPWRVHGDPGHDRSHPGLRQPQDPAGRDPEARSKPGTWATSSRPKAPWPAPARAICTSKCRRAPADQVAASAAGQVPRPDRHRSSATASATST